MTGLSKENYILFARKHYQNPSCLTEEEFLSDLARTRSIKKLITTIVNYDSNNIRLLLNNIISFYNVFDHKAATVLVMTKIDINNYCHLNAFLTFLNLPNIPSYSVSEDLLKRIKEETN